MVNKIAHLADIHIPKQITRHDEYREVFENLYTSLEKDKPDRIVIVGDLYHNFIDQNNETISLAGEFLLKLSELTEKVIITRGNHDLSVKQKQRIDSIETVVNLLNKDNIVYYDKTGFYMDDNICWAVFDHKDKLSPYVDCIDQIPPRDKYRFIDLYHNPIKGATSDIGFSFNEKKYKSMKDFKGDVFMLGDIHKRQFFHTK